MSISADIRTLLIAQIPSTPVEEGSVDFSTGYSRLWYGRSGFKADKFITGGTSLLETVFDVECISDDIDTAQGWADTLRNLDGYTGTFGSTSALAIWVEDQSDDYAPKNTWANDSGLHVASVKMTVVS